MEDDDNIKEDNLNIIKKIKNVVKSCNINSAKIMQSNNKYNFNH